LTFISLRAKGSESEKTGKEEKKNFEVKKKKKKRNTQGRILTAAKREK